jgi:release factor glutamine methyltransferase
MIYEPREDSYLLIQSIGSSVKGKKVLDMGTGSGIIAQKALEFNAKEVVASDINPETLCNLSSCKFRKIQSDLFLNIAEKFDIILFNPPYLPLDAREDVESALSTTGGPKGDEIIIEFLKQAPEYMAANGKIYLVLSSLTPRNRINNIINNLGLNTRKVADKNCCFEKLEVVEYSFGSEQFVLK